MAWKEIFATLGLAFKVFLIIFEKQKSTPPEKRRESLSKLDTAVEKANDKKDLGDLSEWLGGNL